MRDRPSISNLRGDAQTRFDLKTKLFSIMGHPSASLSEQGLCHPFNERLQMLKRIVPSVDKVAMALNGNNANNAAQFELLRSEARTLGIAVESLDIRKPEDVDAAFDKALAFGAKGLLNAVDTFINSRRFALAAGRGKAQVALRLQRRGVCDGGRADVDRSGSLRGLLRCRHTIACPSGCASADVLQRLVACAKSCRSSNVHRIWQALP